MIVALILAGALLTITSCYATGRLVFKAAGLPGESTIQFTTGAAVLSLAIFAMCALHLISTAALVTVALCLCGASFSLRGASAPPYYPKPNLYWIPFAVFGTFYFINALAPEISADGAFYHLAFPARYLQHGGFFAVTTNFYGNLSQGLEMLFLMAFSIGKHSAGALTHFAFLLILAAAIIAYAKQIGHSKPGWLAALVIFTSPVIAMDATIAYNDVAVTAVLFTLFFALTRWDQERTTNWLIVAGLLAGFAYAIKYTAAIATPYAIGFVLWRARTIKAALPVVACATLMIAPWMLKNWLWLDNPVSPFLNRVFPNPNVTITFEDEYRHNLSHFNGASLNWHIPIDAAVTGNKVEGNLGPAFLLAPLALFGLKDSAVRRLLFAGTLFLLPWFANLGTRFLIPCAPFFALAIALTVAKTNWAIPVFAIVQVVISWPTVVGLYCEQYNWRLVDFPVAAALRQIPEEDFIAPRIDTYAIVRMVDLNTPPGSVIYTALPLPEAYSERKYVLNYTGALNQALQEMRWTPFDTDSQPVVRLTFQPKAPRVNALRILQKGHCVGFWSLSEVRWIPEKIPDRTPDRPSALTAQPEPWHAAWAHDGNPATRWKVWQQTQPGMYWEARFDHPQPLETVEIDASPDESNTCIELQTQSAGAWTTFPKSPQIQAIPLSSDIRHRITEEFHKQGITHILIHKDERAASDFETRQTDWGIVKTSESGPARLYRIELETQNIHQK